MEERLAVPAHTYTRSTWPVQTSGSHPLTTLSKAALDRSGHSRGCRTRSLTVVLGWMAHHPLPRASELSVLYLASLWIEPSPQAADLV